MTAAIGIALYGAILSTILAILKGYEYWRDQPRLRVDAGIGELTLNLKIPDAGVMWKDAAAHTGHPPFLAVKVANIGRHPVIVQRIGGSTGGSDFSINYQHVELPQTLEPGRVIEVAGPATLVNRSLESLGVWDQTGRAWMLSRRQLKKLKNQI